MRSTLCKNTDWGISKMKKHYDICVVGFWCGSNYGSLLNGYAVYCLLKKEFGKEVLMLQKPGLKANDTEIEEDHNIKFINKYYDSEDISPIMSYSQLLKLNEICDCFCSGSDQIWNYTLLFNENFYLPFVSDEKKLISFATSFGHKYDKTPDEVKPRIKEYLQRYSAISVREEFDVNILRDNYGLNSTLVFEPVFCIDKRYYQEIIDNTSFSLDSHYLLSYILDPTPKKRETILQYAKLTGFKIVNILSGNPSDWEKNREILDLPGTLSSVGVEEFLKAFSNADFVITDSFHGTAFSIIFNKPFLSIGNYRRGYERFVDLLSRLKLKDRLVQNPQQIPLEEKYTMPIDCEINQIIEREAKKTVEWLKNAVEQPKKSLRTLS